MIQNVYDPQALNRYVFERNNPYKYTDPTGHLFGLDDFVIGLIVIGAAIYSGYILANRLSTIEKSQGGLTGTDVSMAFLDVATIVFPAANVQQFAVKFIGKEAYKGYFDKRIENLKLKEPKKVETTDDLKCKLFNTCNLQYKANTENANGNQPSSNSPSISSPSSQTDSSKAISQSAMQGYAFTGYGPNVGGYSQGTGYVTSGGTTYPTSNPYFSPGTGNTPWGGGYSNVVQDPSTGHYVIAE